MVGTHTALALVAALEHKACTGEGQLVEMPMIEVAAAVTAEQVIDASMGRPIPGRRGAHGVYRCAGDDRWVAVDETSDPMDASARAAWCADRTAEDAASTMLAEGVAAAAVVPAFEVLDDAQLVARDFFQAIDHPDVGPQDYPTWPMRLSAGPAVAWPGPAPTLGQNTDDVLRELGVTDAELDRLRAEHVIGTEPMDRGR
jgi:crotonobetainyl-CoA:carnitine CoA-transferase CaiB-like acyl-CoA transferase